MQHAIGNIILAVMVVVVDPEKILPVALLGAKIEHASGLIVGGYSRKYDVASRSLYLDLISSSCRGGAIEYDDKLFIRIRLMR